MRRLSCLLGLALALPAFGATPPRASAPADRDTCTLDLRPYRRVVRGIEPRADRLYPWGNYALDGRDPGGEGLIGVYRASLRSDGTLRVDPSRRVECVDPEGEGTPPVAVKPPAPPPVKPTPPDSTPPIEVFSVDPKASPALPRAIHKMGLVKPSPKRAAPQRDAATATPAPSDAPTIGDIEADREGRHGAAEAAAAKVAADQSQLTADQQAAMDAARAAAQSDAVMTAIVEQIGSLRLGNTYYQIVNNKLDVSTPPDASTIRVRVTMGADGVPTVEVLPVPIPTPTPPVVPTPPVTPPPPPLTPEPATPDPATLTPPTGPVPDAPADPGTASPAPAAAPRVTPKAPAVRRPRITYRTAGR